MRLRHFFEEEHLESLEFVFHRREEGNGFAVSQVIALNKEGRVQLPEVFEPGRLVQAALEIIEEASMITDALAYPFGCGILVLMHGNGVGNHKTYLRYEFHPVRFENGIARKTFPISLYLDDALRDRLLDAEIGETTIA